MKKLQLIMVAELDLIFTNITYTLLRTQVSLNEIGRKFCMNFWLLHKLKLREQEVCCGNCGFSFLKIDINFHCYFF